MGYGTERFLTLPDSDVPRSDVACRAATAPLSVHRQQSTHGWWHRPVFSLRPWHRVGTVTTADKGSEMRRSSFLAPANSSQRFANQPGWQRNPSCISYRTSSVVSAGPKTCIDERPRRRNSRVHPRFRMARRDQQRGVRKGGCVLAHWIARRERDYIRQRWVASDSDASAMKLQFEVGTGELAPEARFDPHGHVVLINIAGL
jgi:hypothetical protein